MPKKGKKGGKKGGKGKGNAAARALEEQQHAQKLAAEAEAKRRYEEEQAAREATLVLREEALSKREQDALSLESEYRQKLEGIDAEVALRARSGIAAAEAREAACERRAVMREAECQQREQVFAAAERELAVRSIEVAAREAAMGENVIGGVAARLDQMLSEQAVTRDAMLSRHKEIERERAALKVREDTWRDEVLKMEATLAQKEREARGRVEREERKLLQKDFTLKRRLARRIKEAEAIVESHRAECDVRDRRLKVREEEIRRRNTDLVYLLRRARKYEAQTKASLAKENRLPPAGDAAPWDHSPHGFPPARPKTAPQKRGAPVPQTEELDDLEHRAAAGLEQYGGAPDERAKSPNNLYRPPASPQPKYRRPSGDLVRLS